MPCSVPRASRLQACRGWLGCPAPAAPTGDKHPFILLPPLPLLPATVLRVDSVISVTRSDAARGIHFFSLVDSKICNKSKKLNFKLTIEG